MFYRKTCASLVLALALAAAPVLAAEPQNDPHHPAAPVAASPSAAMPMGMAGGQMPGARGMPMMEMMRGMMGQDGRHADDVRAC